MPAVTGICPAKPFGSTRSRTTLNPLELTARHGSFPVWLPNFPAELFGTLTVARQQEAA
jgi:hypothetical protein